MLEEIAKACFKTAQEFILTPWWELRPGTGSPSAPVNTVFVGTFVCFTTAQWRLPLRSVRPTAATCRCEFVRRYLSQNTARPCALSAQGRNTLASSVLSKPWPVWRYCRVIRLLNLDKITDVLRVSCGITTRLTRRCVTVVIQLWWRRTTLPSYRLITPECCLFPDAGNTPPPPRPHLGFRPIISVLERSEHLDRPAAGIGFLLLRAI
jgi:hypothetical protein